MAGELDAVRYDVAVANRVLAELGLATGAMASLGHASLRVPGDPGRFVVKGRGYRIDALAAMRPEQMVVCDLEGNLLEGPPGATQCFEVKLHSCIYQARPDVQSIVHAHPRFTVLMSVLGATLRPMCREGETLVRTPLPVLPHPRLILSHEDGVALAETLGDAPVALLRGHGAATTGRGLAESVTRMMEIEEQARMNWYARCSDGPDHAYIASDLWDAPGYMDRLREMPHFREPMRNSGPVYGGIYPYYAELVAEDLPRPGA